MDKFPTTFCATKVHIDVTLNRGQQIEEDLKTLRKKIVATFKDHTEYHACIDYKFTSDCTPAQRKACYMKIKLELEERQFIVQGKLKGSTLKMLVSSEKPKHNDHKWTMAVLEFIGDGKLTRMGSKLNSRRGSRASSRLNSRRGSRVTSPRPDLLPKIIEVTAADPGEQIVPKKKKKKKKKKAPAAPTTPPPPPLVIEEKKEDDTETPGETSDPPPPLDIPTLDLNDIALTSPPVEVVESVSPEESVYMDDSDDDISHLISDQRLDLEIVREKLEKVKSERASRKRKKKKKSTK
jgi:hypothetical protein